MLSEDERRWAAELLEELRWKPDQLVEPDDYPGQQWYLTPGGFLEKPDGLMPCCQKNHPCSHHDGQPVESHRLSWSHVRAWWECTCERLSAEHTD